MDSNSCPPCEMHDNARNVKWWKNTVWHKQCVHISGLMHGFRTGNVTNWHLFIVELELDKLV